MKYDIFKLFLSLLLIIFSLLWISDKLEVLIENEKYSYTETTEKSDTENQTEIKLKTLFLNQIDVLNLAEFSLLNSTNSNSSYSFKIKEFCFENTTPPPKI